MTEAIIFLTHLREPRTLLDATKAFSTEWPEGVAVAIAVRF
jgi:hypothetical protein